MIFAPTPSPSPTSPASNPFLADQISLEIFLIAIAIVVGCYALGTLLLHAIATLKKRRARKKNSRDNYNSDYNNY